MPGPPEPQRGGAANVALVVVALTMGALAFLTIGVMMVPVSYDYEIERETYDEAAEPLKKPEALLREVEVDGEGVRYVWRDPARGRQVASRLSEVPEWTRRWVGLTSGGWDGGDGLYFADLNLVRPGDWVGAIWRPTSELHAAMQAHDAGGSHAEDIALYAVELLNVNDESERSARAKSLKKFFKEDLEPRLLPERSARFFIGRQAPAQVIGPK